MEVFVAVASVGSFTVAAKELNTSRTALGAMIDALEETFGGQLFNRKRSVGISLTTNGERLLPLAISLLRDAENIGHEIANTQDLSGELLIGATVSLAGTVVPHLLERLAKTHPRLRLRIVVRGVDELIEMLNVGGIELLLSYATSTPVQKLASEALFGTKLGVIAAKTVSLGEGPDVSVNQLAGRSVVILDNAVNRQNLFDYLRRVAAPEIDVKYRVGTLPLCIEIVQRGLALGIVPVFPLMKDQLPESIACYDLNPAPSFYRASISWRPDVSLSFQAKVAIEELRKLCLEQVW